MSSCASLEFTSTMPVASVVVYVASPAGRRDEFSSEAIKQASVSFSKPHTPTTPLSSLVFTVSCIYSWPATIPSLERYLTNRLDICCMACWPQPSTPVVSQRLSHSRFLLLVREASHPIYLWNLYLPCHLPIVS